MPPPPSPPPPPGPTTTTAALQDVDAILKGLPRANIAFNTPTSLSRDESATIELLLSTQTEIEDLKREVTAAGQRAGARIRFTDEMEARLTGQRFSIEAVTPEIQAISRSEVTSWKWEIEPTRTGRQRLHLTLTAILDVESALEAHRADV